MIVSLFPAEKLSLSATQLECFIAHNSSNIYLLSNSSNLYLLNSSNNICNLSNLYLIIKWNALLNYVNFMASVSKKCWLKVIQYNCITGDTREVKTNLIAGLQRKKIHLISCESCSMTFAIQKRFDHRVKEIHDGINMNLKCPWWNKYFKTKNRLKTDLESIPKKRPINAICVRRNSNWKSV